MGQYFVCYMIKTFQYFLQPALINSYILFKTSSEKVLENSMTHKEFGEEIIS